MARSSTPRKVWIGLSMLGALSVTLAAGWWLGRRAQIVEVKALRSQAEHAASQDSVKELRSENDDLIHFIDEAYTLLNEEGIHIQLDLEVDQDGRYRLSADSANLKDELKAKLRELKEKGNDAPPNN